nr:plasmid replication protein RepC [Methylobacterium oryzae]
MDHITTPFGRRTLSPGMVAAQVGARATEGKVAHKWKTFRAIAEAKEALGISDRTLVVLNALLTCLPETAMVAGNLVVFPSNKALSLRAHGMAETTLRRHLGALVQAGLVVRRDSPNGKRYALRGGEGVEQAYGLDLSPVLARAEEFEHLAAEAAAERRASALARGRVTIYRRDIAKMIEAGAAAGAVWQSYREAFAPLCFRLPRRVTAASLAPLLADLHSLASELGRALEGLLKTQNLDGNASQSGVHIENSKPEGIIVVEPAPEDQGPGRTVRDLPLALVKSACPDIVLYDRGSVATWRDLISTAGLVRGMLGVSASAWEDAKDTMGPENAAAVIAGILQRAEAIKSPGGYLRGLTEKSRAGQFSPWPMMLALLRQSSPGPKSGSPLSGSRGGGSSCDGS